MRTKILRCGHIASWLGEEGVEVRFGRDADCLDEYLIIQRHFEEPDDGTCYVETDDPNFCGFFHLVRAKLAPDRLEVWLGDRKVEVEMSAAVEEVEAAQKVLAVLIPKISPLSARGS